ALPISKPGVEIGQDIRRPGARLACPHHGDLVAASEDMHPELVFDLRQVAVKLSAQVDQQAIVGEFQQCLVQVFGTRRRGQGADAQASLLEGSDPGRDRDSPSRSKQEISTELWRRAKRFARVAGLPPLPLDFPSDQMGSGMGEPRLWPAA